MSKFAEPMTRLIDELKKLPGIGSKSAQRLAFHILRSSDEDAEGLAAAFGSSQTPAAPSMVSQLFGQSNSQQQAGLLNTLIASAGPSIVSQLLAGGGASNLASLVSSGQTELTPQQAAQVSPETVQEIAEHAEKHDPSLMDKLGEFYSEHPGLVKTLGAAALAVAMSGMTKEKRGLI